MHGHDYGRALDVSLIPFYFCIPKIDTMTIVGDLDFIDLSLAHFWLVFDIFFVENVDFLNKVTLLMIYMTFIIERSSSHCLIFGKF